MLNERRYSILAFGAFVLLLLLLTGCMPLRPQWSHQGRLYDNAGRPVANGNYTIQYRLFHASSGGTQLYTETDTVAVNDGLFTTTIGNSTVITPEIFSQPTWIEIAVNGETMAPRQELLGAPYAASLVPNSVIQGSVPIARTFMGYENTGSNLTVMNTDTSATGGNGLIVFNQAAATGPNRDQVAALQVIAAGGSGTTGGLGAKIVSQNYRGMYVQAGDNWAAAVFDSPYGIILTGGGVCYGCSPAYFAQNSGSEAIQAGDFVVAEGVQVDPDLNVPVMLVRKAANAAEPVVGVATGAVTRTPVGEFYGTTTGGFDPSGGPAQVGDYLSVVVQGLVEARVDPGVEIAIGDHLTISSGQATRADGTEIPVAQVMSEVSPDGFVWILFQGR